MSSGTTETTQTVALPEWYEDYSKYVIDQAKAAQNVGYVPYMGPSVAAYTPAQQAAFNNVNAAAGAYGMEQAAGTGLPPPTTYAGGVQGYSSYPMYEQSLQQLQKQNPAQYGLLMGYQPK